MIGPVRAPGLENVILVGLLHFIFDYMKPARRREREGLGETHGFPSSEDSVKVSVVVQSNSELREPGHLKHEDVLTCGYNEHTHISSHY